MKCTKATNLEVALTGLPVTAIAGAFNNSLADRVTVRISAIWG